MAETISVLVAVIEILLGVAIIFGVVAILSYPVSFPWLATKLARYKKIVRSTEEGTCRAIERNEKLHRFITPGRETDPVRTDNPHGPNFRWPIPQQRRPSDEPLESTDGPESPIVDFIDRHLPGGVRWVGFNFLGYHIKEYHFRWNVLRESKPRDDEAGMVDKRQLDSGKWVVTFAQTLDYIYLRDSVYEFELNRAETKELMEIDIVMTATVRIIDPYLALFQIHDWLESMLDVVRPVVRAWTKERCYEAVVGRPESFGRLAGDILLMEHVVYNDDGTEERMTIGHYMESRYGVRIKRIGFEEVNPPDEFAEAATQRVAALQNKEATITNAEAQREADRIIGEGEAQRLRAVLEVVSASPDALDLRKIEALENVGKNGNTIVLGGENANLLLSPPQKRLIEPQSERTRKKGND